MVIFLSYVMVNLCKNYLCGLVLISLISVFAYCVWKFCCSFSSVTAYAARGIESMLTSFKAPQVEINAVI